MVLANKMVEDAAEWRDILKGDFFALRFCQGMDLHCAVGRESKDEAARCRVEGQRWTDDRKERRGREKRGTKRGAVLQKARV